MPVIRNVAVVGAGTMGSAIAQHFCTKGLEVILSDLDAAALARGRESVRRTLEEGVGRKIFTEAEAAAILGRLRCSTRREDLAGCDLVVEAVFEDLAVKQALFRDLERAVTPGCILASNTSSFLITEIAEGLQHPERVAGVHYFYHAAKNKLVELIPGRRTAPAVIDRLWRFYASCDKVPIRVQDAPGFAVNRFFVPWLNEAVRLWEEGKGSIAGIDAIARDLFQIGMGPFALMNATGVPIARHAAQGLADKCGPLYAPAEALRRQVESGKPWDLEDATIRPAGPEQAALIRERLLAAAIGVAAQMVSEGVTDAASADLGARVGLRWPRGPFEMAGALGAPAVRAMMAKYFGAWQLTPPALPAEITWVRSFTSGRNGFIVFDIPDRMNALSEEVLRQLAARWEAMERTPGIETVFFTGRGKAFVAGADIKFFLDAIDAGDLDRIARFTESGQALLQRIGGSSLRTVAYLNGLTLGGGLELALACRHRVASTKAVLAFPETGIGIYPGLGGTQRTPRRIGRGLAKYLIATGQMIDAPTALKYGLVDQVIPPVGAVEELGQLRFDPAERPAGSLPEGEAFESFDGVLGPTPAEGALKEYDKVLRRKAPVALRTAMALVDEGQGLELGEALKREMAPLKQVFATQDARNGLSSILTRTRPAFTGA